MNRDEAYIAKQVALLNHRFIHSEFYGGISTQPIDDGDNIEEPVDENLIGMPTADRPVGTPEQEREAERRRKQNEEEARIREEERINAMTEKERQAYYNQKQEQERQKQRGNQNESEREKEERLIDEYYNDLMEGDQREYDEWKADLDNRNRQNEEDKNNTISDLEKTIQEDKKMKEEEYEKLQKNIEDIYNDTQQQLQVKGLKGYKPCASDNYDEDDDHEELIDEEAEQDAEEDRITTDMGINNSKGGKLPQAINKIIEATSNIHNKKKIKNKQYGGGGLSQFGKVLFPWAANAGTTLGGEFWEADSGKKKQQRDMMRQFVKEECIADHQYEMDMEQMENEYQCADKQEAEEYEEARKEFEKSLEGETEADKQAILSHLDNKRADYVKQRDATRAKQQADLEKARQEADEYEDKMIKETMEKTKKLDDDYEKEIEKNQKKEDELQRRVTENVDNKKRLQQEGIDTSKMLGNTNCNVTTTSDSKMRHDAIQEERAKIKKEEEDEAKGVTPTEPNGKGKPRKNKRKI